MMAFNQATVLVALCALLTVALASEQKLFAELLHESKAGVASKQSSYAPADVKHICLTEAKQYNCRTVGCQEITSCDRRKAADGKQSPTAKESGPCPDCVTRYVFQSDVTCCSSKKEYGYEANDSPDGTGFDSPYLRIGTCDWDMLTIPGFLDALNVNARREERQIDLKFAERLGTAWATCYLTSGAELCDETLCDNMVLSIQGGLYLTAARSPVQKSLANNDNPDDTCGPFIGELRRYEADNGTVAETEYFPGKALLVSGTVTATSLDKKVEYPMGHLDYVYDFLSLVGGDLEALEGEINASADEFPKVMPNSYNIKLVGSKKATY